MLAELQANISKICFLITKFSDTGSLALSVNLQLKLHSKEFDLLNYLFSQEFSSEEIPDNLSQEIEKEIRQSKNCWEPMLKQLENNITTSTIFDTFKKQAETINLK